MAGKTYVVPVAGDSPEKLIHDIDALEQRANAMHLYPAGRALNNAKNAAGWQIAGNIGEADTNSTRRL